MSVKILLDKEKVIRKLCSTIVDNNKFDFFVYVDTFAFHLSSLPSIN